MKHPNTAPQVTRPWRGESAQDRRQQRQARFLEAALASFARHGIAKTTMRDICAEARLTERYFYESFQSTEHAFEQVYASLKGELVQRVSQALLTAPKDIESLAREGLRAFYIYIQEDPRRGQIMLIDAVSANQQTLEKSRHAIKEYVALMAQLASDLLPLAQREQLDMDWLAWGLLGMAIQVGSLWIGEGMKRPVDEVLAYNLYAWRGLAGWLMSPTADAGQPTQPKPPASPAPG
jgi:AcrR family transcriptional regulator